MKELAYDESKTFPLKPLGFTIKEISASKAMCCF